MSSQKVLWVWAHPDDETLAGGLSLRQHLEEGYDCHVIMCTRGTASGMLDTINGAGAVNTDWGMAHSPTAESYAPLTGGLDGTFGAARIQEMTNALTVLASGTGVAVTVHELGLQDGAVTQADVLAGIYAVYAAVAAPGEVVWLKGHSDLVLTEHPDHLQVGHAIRAAAAAFPATLGVAPRFYIDPALVGYTSAALPASAKGAITARAGTNQAAATLGAARCYNAWNPAGGTYAIGRQSVPADWLATPHNTWHA